MRGVVVIYWMYLILFLKCSFIYSQSVCEGARSFTILEEYYVHTKGSPFLIWNNKDSGSGFQHKKIIDTRSTLWFQIDLEKLIKFKNYTFLEVEIQVHNGESYRSVVLFSQDRNSPVASLDGFIDDLYDVSNAEEFSFDLKMAGIANGDLLYLKANLKYYPNYLDSTFANSEMRELEIQLGRYQVKKTRWNSDVSDAFMLINRIGEEEIQNMDNVSLSNFKGAPGAALTYHWYDDGTRNRKIFSRIFNRLEPSWGFQINYIDFDLTKDLELGLGAVLGLFRGQMIFSFGYNLNSNPAPGKPFYFGLGISFANLVAKK